MAVMKAKRAMRAGKGLLKRPAKATEEPDAEDPVAEEVEESDECEAEEEATEVPKKRPAAAMVKTAPAKKAKAKEITGIDANEEADECEAEEEATEVPKKRPAAAKAAGRMVKAVRAKRAKAKETTGVGANEEAAEYTQDEGSASAIASRKKELRAMAAVELKSLVQSKGLDVGTKAENVEAVLAQEARVREAEAKKAEEIRGIEKRRRDEFEAKSGSELKALCEEKGLKLGGTKEDKVERLLAKVKEDGEIDEAYNAVAREARRTELMSLDKAAVLGECAKLGVDPLVKEVMVERILVRESSTR